MDAVIHPGPLHGTIEIPSSKSAVHRELIAAALAHGTSHIANVSMSQDIEATIRILTALGASFAEEGNDGTKVNLAIHGGLKKKEGTLSLFAGESGSTLRFLIPVALVSGNTAVFTGAGRLSKRPLTPYYDIFDEKGISYSGRDGLPLTVSGTLKPGIYRMPGNVSSQFFTGLLMALPLLSGDSEIIAASPLESKSYIDMTVSCLARFGVTVTDKGNGHYHVPGNQEYRPLSMAAEGDDSQSAFWLAAGNLNGRIGIKGLSDGSIQGDRAIQEIIRAMGGMAEKSHDGSVTAETSGLHGITVDVSNVPDLVPALAVLMALADGTSEITGAARVRLKECDRLHAMAEELNRLGAKVTELPEGLHIEGVNRLHGGEVSAWNDHRIAMALAVASTKMDGTLIIHEAESVRKSYPSFWEDFKKAGGRIELVS